MFLIIIILTSLSSSSFAKIPFSIMKPNASSIMEEEVEYFTNTWAVRILGGYEKAKRTARRLGYNILEKISEGVPDIYLFIDSKQPEEMKRASESITKLLKNVPEISWVEQQVTEAKETRHYFRKTCAGRVTASPPSWHDPTEALSCPHSKHVTALNFNDEHWPEQFYLKDCREDNEGPPRDLNLAPVWVKHKLFGKGIKVIVVDSGIEKKHLELIDNYDPSLGLDVQDNDKDPEPRHYWWYPRLLHVLVSHGTACAGIIGMKANNTICGVGIAPLVTLGAVRYLGMKGSTDYMSAAAFLFKHVEVHIMSNSWGPADPGMFMPTMHPLTKAALKIGVTKGREGRGLIYVFSAGNFKECGDNCGMDPYVSSIYTISVGTCTYRGKISTFSERCPSVMVVTYNGKVAPTMGGRCITDFYGTSASAPVVSGAIALALEANPLLSWRDVQHLLAWTCQMAPLQHNPIGTWDKNAAGFYVSHDFGFGLLNINDLVEKAKVFRGVGPMHTCVTKANLNEFGDAGKAFTDRVKVEISTDGCENSPSEVAHLEHVQLTVSLWFPRRGDLKISLISPSGTRARLLDSRRLDFKKEGLRFRTFDSVMTWGESPKGRWTILITSKKRKNRRSLPFKSTVKKFWSISGNTRNTPSNTFTYNPDDVYALDESARTGEVNDLTLTFHGTSRNHLPDHYRSGPRSYRDSPEL